MESPIFLDEFEFNEWVAFWNEYTVSTFDAILAWNARYSEHNLIEGDIRPDLQSSEVDNVDGKRNAIRDRNKLWFTRNIPYTLSDYCKFCYSLVLGLFYPCTS